MARLGLPNQAGDPYKQVDRAAMIEAASRCLRQQMGGRSRERPRSKGSLHDIRGFWDGGSGSLPESKARGPDGLAASSPAGSTSGVEAAQKSRNHSVENNNRVVAAGAVGRGSHYSASDLYNPAEEETLAALPVGREDWGSTTCGGSSGSGAAVAPPHEDSAPLFPPAEELKRPHSRKKGPSASAAAGLGAFAGPAPLTDAFEQRKTRQPIPVESWGPRPPSRHGLPSSTKADSGGRLESEDALVISQVSPSSRHRSEGAAAVGRPNSRAGSDPFTAQMQKSGSQSTVVGGTWAAARGTGGQLRGSAVAGGFETPPGARRGGVGSRASTGQLGAEGSDSRRGRAQRGGRGATPVEGDLGVFGRGARALAADRTALGKSSSGVFDRASERGYLKEPRPFEDNPGAASAGQRQHGAWGSFNLDSVGGGTPSLLVSSLSGAGASATSLGSGGVGAATWDADAPEDGIPPPSAGAWPCTPSSGAGTSSPVRRARHSFAEASSGGGVGTPVHLEDVEADYDGGLRADISPPQVIVTRSSQGGSRGRSDLRRRNDQRPSDKDQGRMPFESNLDSDFLRLFAS
eukprot:TRINITY_DN8788_c0_g1_i1.p1 TRINITY_DN8788_c0_g1~~TRINITY_DN8788_c0_g1_i1.p1  ORF type:complete len:576 (-),score=97.55 TRINITY_DN8788_c0_g1_i1:74-1801(-)